MRKTTKRVSPEYTEATQALYRPGPPSRRDIEQALNGLRAVYSGDPDVDAQQAAAKAGRVLRQLAEFHTTRLADLT